ncbi:histidine kinase [bacterium]|nr:histidine kinase [bacterium]
MAFRDRRILFAANLFIVATIFGFATTIDSFTGLYLWDRPFDLRYAYWEFIGSYLWLLLIAPIAYLVRHYPLKKGKVLRHGILHILASIVVAATHLCGQFYLGELMFSFLGYPCPPLNFADLGPTIYKLTWRIPAYLVIATICHMLAVYHRLRGEELKVVHLESELAQARVKALKTRINPELIFRAFSEIAALIHQDTKKATQKIVKLADNLRSSISFPVDRKSLPSPCGPSEKPAEIQWGWMSLCWIVVGLFFTARMELLRFMQGSSLSWTGLVFLNAPWLLWAVLTPFLLRLCERFPLESKQLAKSLSVHIPLSLSVWIFTMISAVITQNAINEMTGKPSKDLLLDATGAGLTKHLLIYWSFVFFVTANRYYSRYVQRELTVSSLQLQLSSAHLQALNMQLHPHFLFNTLHALIGLIQEDRDAAQRMLQQLKNFFQLTLQQMTVQKVLLQKELEFLKYYLDIQKTRFQDRLVVNVEADPAALGVPVPNLILQPLVENAIKHGIARRMQQGEIQIKASIVERNLHICVEDNGPGIAQTNLKEGIGMSNTRERLLNFYGGSFRFEAGNSANGFRVLIEIPVESTKREVA